MKKRITTYPDRSGLTDQQAEDLLDKLRTHYNQPVLPLGRFCNAMYDWVRALEMLDRRKKAEPQKYRETYQGNEYVSHLHRIITDVNKSGLLFRLLYLGEPLRTEMCPIHLGSMDMQIWVGFPDAGTCECNGTGWLPNAEDPGNE